MKLRMRIRTDSAEDLPAYENELETGSMGDCVTAIVLWDFVGGRARKMRGFHGLGGIKEINWTSLFASIPDGPNIHVYVFAGPLNSPRDESLRDAIPVARAAAPATATFRMWHYVGSATVDRAGKVSELRGLGTETPFV